MRGVLKNRLLKLSSPSHLLLSFFGVATTVTEKVPFLFENNTYHVNKLPKLIAFIITISFTRKRQQKDNSNDYKANCTISPS
jgi:hypothetical protein